MDKNILQAKPPPMIDAGTQNPPAALPGLQLLEVTGGLGMEHPLLRAGEGSSGSQQGRQAG